MFRRSTVAAAGLSAMLAISACSSAEDAGPSERTAPEVPTSGTATSEQRKVDATPARALQGVATAKVGSSELSGTKFEEALDMQIGLLPDSSSSPSRSSSGNPWGLAVQAGGVHTLTGGAEPKASDFRLWPSCGNPVDPEGIERVSDDVWILTFPNQSGNFGGATSFADDAGTIIVTLNEVISSDNLCEEVADIKEGKSPSTPRAWGWAADQSVIPSSQLHDRG